MNPARLSDPFDTSFYTAKPTDQHIVNYWMRRSRRLKWHCPSFGGGDKWYGACGQFCGKAGAEVQKVVERTDCCLNCLALRRRGGMMWPTD